MTLGGMHDGRGDMRTSTNAGNEMFLGRESNGGRSGYSAQHWGGLDTSVTVPWGIVRYLTVL